MRMGRRPDIALAALVALVALAISSCSSPPHSRALVVGHHRLRLVAPKGWEHLDHGRQQIFRWNEHVISLTDLGPASPEGMTREIVAARDLYRQGRTEAAFARVGEMGGPALRMMTNDQRREFWQPWTDIRYREPAADSFEVKTAFEALIERCRVLPGVPVADMAGYVIARTVDMREPEISRRTRQGHRGTEWTEVNLWDRLTHLQQIRLAITVSGGYLLVLRIERGTIELAGPAYEGMLESIELEPPPPRPAG